MTVCSQWSKDDGMAAAKSTSSPTNCTARAKHSPCRMKSEHNNGQTPLHEGVLDTNIVEKVFITSGVAFYCNVVAKQRLLKAKIEKNRDRNKTHAIRVSRQCRSQNVTPSPLSTCHRRLAIANRIHTVMLMLCQAAVLFNVYIVYRHWCEVSAN